MPAHTTYLKPNAQSSDVMGGSIRHNYFLVGWGLCRPPTRPLDCLSLVGSLPTATRVSPNHRLLLLVFGLYQPMAWFSLSFPFSFLLLHFSSFLLLSRYFFHFLPFLFLLVLLLFFLLSFTLFLLSFNFFSFFFSFLSFFLSSHFLSLPLPLLLQFSIPLFSCSLSTFLFFHLSSVLSSLLLSCFLFHLFFCFSSSFFCCGVSADSQRGFMWNTCLKWGLYQPPILVSSGVSTNRLPGSLPTAGCFQDFIE